MKKNAWITVLKQEDNEEEARKLHQTLSKYGLGTGGHFWRDDLPQMAWSGALEELGKADTGIWIIAGRAVDFSEPNLRYGLSMLTAGVQALRGNGFPILIAMIEGELEADSLPTLLRGAGVYPATSPTLGAKMAAKANLPIPKLAPEYHLNVYGIPNLGQWFEIGPADGAWKGALFGVNGGEIVVQGVGPAGKLPEKATLEYPIQGMKLELAGDKYTAWGVQNQLSPDMSHYVKVNDHATSLVFGPMPDGDAADLFVLRLK